jgi:hypothetical protein
MRAIVVDDRKLEIAIEGRGRDRLPHVAIDAWIGDGVFDLDQFAPAGLVKPRSQRSQFCRVGGRRSAPMCGGRS